MDGAVALGPVSILVSPAARKYGGDLLVSSAGRSITVTVCNTIRNLSIHITKFDHLIKGHPLKQSESCELCRIYMGNVPATWGQRFFSGDRIPLPRTFRPYGLYGIPKKPRFRRPNVMADRLGRR